MTFLHGTLFLLICYLAGSVPMGFVLVKLFTGKDLRTIGSGNVGSTNAKRAGGPLVGALSFTYDSLKGAVAVLVGMHLAGPFWAMAGGMAAFLGHLYPIWLKFKGGKGVATGVGIAVALFPPSSLMAAVVWLIVRATTGYVSLASIAATISVVTFVMLANISPFYTVCVPIMGALIVWRHRSNFQRILEDKENRAPRYLFADRDR